MTFVEHVQLADFFFPDLEHFTEEHQSVDVIFPILVSKKGCGGGWELV